LQVGDFLVIGHWYRVTGGGNGWYNHFDGSASDYSHVNGPFVRSDLFIGGPTLDSRALAGAALYGDLIFYTHVVVDTDLVDAASSSQGNLTRFGWASTAPYASALAMWTLRGVGAYASNDSVSYENDMSGLLTPNTNLLNEGDPSRLQLVFGLAQASNQAAAGGPFPSTTVSNKDDNAHWEVLKPTPKEWTSTGNYVDLSFLALSSMDQADASDVEFTHTVTNTIGAGNGSVGGLLMKITFADDVGPPVGPVVPAALYQKRHLTVKALPYDLRDTMRGIDLLGREQ
jgi:hypothetical protein